MARPPIVWFAGNSPVNPPAYYHRPDSPSVLAGIAGKLLFPFPNPFLPLCGKNWGRDRSHFALRDPTVKPRRLKSPFPFRSTGLGPCHPRSG